MLFFVKDRQMLMNDQVMNNSSILKVLVLVAPVTAESLKKTWNP